ncbi:MAG: DEAD/DEAH box helicase [candidate division KSB1 bacterium]|nr:DEAD/DEAH box helicase [candidate division KSB1 bacterium]MDZ7341068.1 DEAD/DEAH box helicase [candidate division KSB1 bacterium]
MTIEQILDLIRSDSDMLANITHWQKIPARDARYAEFPAAIHPELIEILKKRGIQKLYIHQAEAIAAVLAQKNVVVVTPTASGKTLCYNVPVLNALIDNPETRALYLFPTKALSQDQLDELYGISTALNRNIKTYTFDGDTPASARKAIRSAGHIVVTNPDMLHQGILPHHTKWIKLFENLKYVVIDEIHHYRGVFGSHLANIIRRLKRICKFYGSDPQFICCSATIGNPKELAEKILEAECILVDNNGAPRGEKHFILYNPPVVNFELGIRRSVLNETKKLAEKFLSSKIQTIVFARSRLRVEILVTYLKEIMQKLGQSPRLVRGYRGGYLPLERREIEKGLREGEILGVVSTNALELGIDIGQLSVCLMAGYPGTITSSWQQAGRAGRRAETSVAILVASSAPIDQFIINHPEYFFGQSPEMGIVDPNNLIILMSHLKCAAFELPFEDGERFGSDATQEMLAYLEEHGVLHHVGERWHWTSEIYPAQEISLRSASPENFVIIDTTRDERVIGEVDYFSAPMLIYEEAIYIHESRQYHVDKLDWERRKAYVHEVEVDHYTDAQTKTDLKVLDVFDQQEVKGGAKAHGEVSVTTVTVAYKKIKFHTHENIGMGNIHLPELEMHTTAYWLEFAEGIEAELRLSQSDMADALKALANVLENVAPFYVMGDPSDLRTVPMIKSPFSKRATIYIYDAYPGGVGYSRKLFYAHDDLLQAAKKLILECPCKSGCPSCVGPVLDVGEVGKENALKLLAFMV